MRRVNLLAGGCAVALLLTVAPEASGQGSCGGLLQPSCPPPASPPPAPTPAPPAPIQAKISLGQPSASPQVH